MSHELSAEERNLLSFLYAKHGGRTKAMIHFAWETGDYSDLTIKSDDETILQTIRNQRGPSWLQGLSLKSL